jgi:hypothetical protein
MEGLEASRGRKKQETKREPIFRAPLSLTVNNKLLNLGHAYIMDPPPPILGFKCFTVPMGGNKVNFLSSLCPGGRTNHLRASPPAEV